jgi:hypothetical protein
MRATSYELRTSNFELGAGRETFHLSPTLPISFPFGGIFDLPTTQKFAGDDLSPNPLSKTSHLERGL